MLSALFCLALSGAEETLLEWPKLGYQGAIRLGWSPYHFDAGTFDGVTLQRVDAVPTLTFVSERELFPDLYGTADLGFLPHYPLYGLEGEIGLKKRLALPPWEGSAGLRGGALMAMGDVGSPRKGWRSSMSGYTFGWTPTLGLAYRWARDVAIEGEIGYRQYLPLQEWTYQEREEHGAYLEKRVRGEGFPTLSVQGWTFRLGFTLGF